MKNISDKIKNALNNVGKGAKRAVATGLVALALPFAGYALENESNIPLATFTYVSNRPEPEYKGKIIEYNLLSNGTICQKDKPSVTYSPFWFYDLNGNGVLDAEEIEANKMGTLIYMDNEFNEKANKQSKRLLEHVIKKSVELNQSDKKQTIYNNSFLEEVPIEIKEELRYNQSFLEPVCVEQLPGRNRYPKSLTESKKSKESINEDVILTEETQPMYNNSLLEEVPIEIKKESRYISSFLEEVNVKQLPGRNRYPKSLTESKKSKESINDNVNSIKSKGNPSLDLTLATDIGFSSANNFGGSVGMMYNFNNLIGLGVEGSISFQPENVIEEYHGNPTPFGTTYSFVESETETNLGAMLVGKVGPVTIGIGAGQERKTTEVNEEISLAGRKNLTSTLTEVITPTFAIEGGIEFDVTKNFSVGASVGYNSGRGIYGGVTSSIKINEWDSKKEEGGK